MKAKAAVAASGSRSMRGRPFRASEASRQGRSVFHGNYGDEIGQRVSCLSGGRAAIRASAIWATSPGPHSVFGKGAILEHQSESVGCSERQWIVLRVGHIDVTSIADGKLHERAASEIVRLSPQDCGHADYDRNSGPRVSFCHSKCHDDLSIGAWRQPVFGTLGRPAGEGVIFCSHWA